VGRAAAVSAVSEEERIIGASVFNAIDLHFDANANTSESPSFRNEIA